MFLIMLPESLQMTFMNLYPKQSILLLLTLFLF